MDTMKQGFEDSNGKKGITYEVIGEEDAICIKPLCNAHKFYLDKGFKFSHTILDGFITVLRNT